MADLTSAQITGFATLLEGRLATLQENVRQELLKSDSEQYVQLADRVHDLGEQSVATLLADVNLAIIDLHIKEIRDVEAALIRIRTGTYGRCIDCGEEIEEGRLRTYPTAKRCRNCQTTHEAKVTAKPTPTL